MRKASEQAHWDVKAISCALKEGDLQLYLIEGLFLLVSNTSDLRMSVGLASIRGKDGQTLSISIPQLLRTVKLRHSGAHRVTNCKHREGEITERHGAREPILLFCPYIPPNCPCWCLNPVLDPVRRLQPNVKFH